MNITDVRVRISRAEEEVKLKAYADVTFEDAFVIHGLKVIEGKNGLFVAMPSRRMPNGEFKDIAHPIKTDVRTSINEIVVKKYQDLVNVDVIAEA
ncbi:septation regulator SpoVG [Haliovirga abyssi]|uniref:Putative septation protein SpoVG n=1 Tax=Haliovirga abyssi TaxID=2996794 RepID=A0AAU9DGT1_9FUSO|nr:septation regulator SpoVG [Haliovirga abyssi]BDU51488.1 septation protein SpoVG [Haliovirga abyssi]